MARPAPAPAKPRNVSIRAKPPPAKKARKPKAQDPGDPVPDPLRNISSLALDLSDELSELKETYRAFGCLERLLVPVEIQRSDEFYVTPTELRALVALVHAEFGRRIDAVGVAVKAIQTASATPRNE
jgi:hypothetical protein